MSLPFKKGVFIAAWAVVISLFSTVFSQIDQTIYYQYCVAQPDSVCFEPVEGGVDTVGLDVGALAGDFRFCLEVDTVDSGYAPVRVVLVLDNSLSMCQNPQAMACCVDGDSSGNCMNNDPGNMRVEAAHVFVDSLRAINPQSEVGVVVFFEQAREYGLLSLSTEENVQQVHSWIDNASCDEGQSGLGTNLGRGLQSGLSLVDEDYDELLPLMTRHIILLTDGAWDDLEQRPPDGLFDTYTTSYPDRTLPVVHGVFLSDSATHVEHGYPWQGCAGYGPVDLSYLEYTAALTGGLYFPGSQPETVIENFLTLLDSVLQFAPQMLTSLTVTNQTNGEVSSSGTIIQVGDSPTWEATLNNLPIVYGDNLLTVERTINLPGRGDTTITTNVLVVRSTTYREVLDSDLYKEYCELVQATIRVTASPDNLPANELFDASVEVSNASNFRLDTVQARLITRFPDSEGNVIATFHLDGNLNNAGGGDPGVGTPNYTTTRQLFGSGGMSLGSFSYSLPQMPDAFVMEAWVNPVNGAGVLFSGGGIEIGVDAESKLYFRTDTGIVAQALVPIDDGVWSHVGAARNGGTGTVTLFVNGLAVSRPAAFSAPIAGGAIEINTPDRWVVDEVRFSNGNRIEMDGSTQMLRLPGVVNASWVLSGTESSSGVLKIPPSAWDSLSLDFDFASPVAGRMVLNIRQKNAGDVGTGWSKNSNPVEVAADLVGPRVTKATLSFGPLGTSGTDKFDTLKIEFNEPVNCETLLDVSHPEFTFLISRVDDNGTERDIADLLDDSKYVIERCSQEYISTVSLLVLSGINPNTDSIRVIGDAVVDTAGNIAPKEGVQKGDIVWGEGTDTRVAQITELEGSEGNMTIDPGVAVDLGAPAVSEGKLVVITSIRPFKIIEKGGARTPDKVGHAMIYDAVGNLIVPETDIYQSILPGVYFIIWDGKNRNNRRVGEGAYHIRFFFTYESGEKGLEKVNVLINW